MVKNVSKEKFHPCPVPVKLMERIILLTTKEGDTILDPFMGSGTTALACINTNRNFIGFELDKHYCDIANERIQKAIQDKDVKNTLIWQKKELKQYRGGINYDK